ncbi:MAG TPA: DUF222 domain-containing protein, partial [Steroidobacteraceae bacterium]
VVGLHGTASHVAKLVRQYRRVLEVERLSREERQQAGRSVSYYFDDEDGSLVLKALEAALPELPLPREDCDASLHVPCGTSEYRVVQPSLGPKIPKTAQRADALTLIAESFLAHGAESLSGGDRLQIVVHVEQETLRERAAGRSEFEDGPGLAAESARRQACDCSYVKITEDEQGEPLNVGRKTRSIPPGLRRALKSRDKGCVFPGCTHTKYVDGHHVHHWANGGETKLDNLVTLCRFHHRLVHEGGVAIERLDDGAWRFVKPGGESFVSTAPNHTRPMQGDWASVMKEHAERDIHIDQYTARTQWRGEPMDYGIAIDILLSRTLKAANAPPTDRSPASHSRQP